MDRYLSIYRDPPLDGPTNMARDEHLLYNPDVAPAALRIYGWTPPTISLGYFQRYADVAKLPDDVRNLAVVRRSTGGGAILHDQEVTYCLVVDGSQPIARQAPDALYRLAHGCWLAALRATGCAVDVAPDSFPMPSPRTGPFFCFEKPGRTDLVVGDAKLLGSAQRRITSLTPRYHNSEPRDDKRPDLPAAGRVLQHGSLLLSQRFASHPGYDLGDPPAEAVESWIESFINRIATALELEPRRLDWLPAQQPDIDQRRQRYASDAWTQRR
ncbi:MAG: hypothetical protein JXO22_05110 [Phycisphaerae bacterium]|nr:hypothetical protein [Phycisphaerae bacterium]